MSAPKSPEQRLLKLALDEALWVRLKAEAERLGFAAPEDFAVRILARQLAVKSRPGATGEAAPLDAFLAEAQETTKDLGPSSSGARRGGIDFGKIQERARSAEEPSSPYLAHLIKG